MKSSKGSVIKPMLRSRSGSLDDLVAAVFKQDGVSKVDDLDEFVTACMVRNLTVLSRCIVHSCCIKAIGYANSEGAYENDGDDCILTPEQRDMTGELVASGAACCMLSPLSRSV